ncbi:MAG: hypothetical protein JSU07_02510 [Bacteroidetes bacterium]|nr:hypothetical protein [Bacteroidota bacterium]
MRNIQKISLFAGLALVLLSDNLSAATSAHINENTCKTIAQQIHVNNLFINKNQKIEVLFTTNENGKVNFALAKTQNDVLKKHLESAFLKLTLLQLKANNVYAIELKITVK